MKPRTVRDLYFNIDYQLDKRPLRGMLADMYFPIPSMARPS